MMTSSVAGIDPHQDSFTVGIVDANGVELSHETFPTTAVGYLAAIELLTERDVEMVGIEGSARIESRAVVGIGVVIPGGFR